MREDDLQGWGSPGLLDTRLGGLGMVEGARVEVLEEEEARVEVLVEEETKVSLPSLVGALKPPEVPTPPEPR